MLRIGHRGAKGYLDENTIESIQKAFLLKAQGIELDVHKCKTGEIVVHHDFTIDRTTNGTGEIANKTHKEIQDLRTEHQFKVPDLKTVLEILPPKAVINIELKGRFVAAETVVIIEQYVAANKIKLSQIIVSSFQKQELLEVYKLNKTIQLGVLTQASVKEVLPFAKSINAYSIHPNYTLLTPLNVKQAQESGFKVFAWTVNDKKDVLRIRDYGVNGIISDFPDRL